MNCNFCQSPNVFCCYSHNDSNLIKCKSCGGFFFINHLDEYAMENYYKKTYSHVHREQLHNDLKQKYESGFFTAKIQDFLNFLNESKIERQNRGEKIKIVDFGSSYGYLLEAAKDKSLEPLGIEFDDVVSEFNESNLGIPMTNIDKLQDSTIDIIYSSHTIEHLTDPYSILEIFHKKLKKGGIVIITCPCFSDKITQSDVLRLYDFVFPEHLSYFTLDSMKSMLENIGYSVELNISQFANNQQSLRNLGIKNQDFESDLNKVLESKPFFAGANLFTVARKITDECKTKKNTTSKILVHNLLDDARGKHYKIDSEKEWHIDIPIKTQTKEITVSGNIITLQTNQALMYNEESQIQVCLITDHSEYDAKSMIFPDNDQNIFVLNNSKANVLYVRISGKHKTEFFIYDLIVTENL